MKLSTDETVSFSLELNVDQVHTEIRQLMAATNRLLFLMGRIVEKGNVSDAIRNMQKAIVIANQLRIALIALQAASGPLGWILAIAATGTFAMTMTDMYDETRGS